MWQEHNSDIVSAYREIVGCHYNAVEYDMIFSAALQWLNHYPNQKVSILTNDATYLTLMSELWESIVSF